MAEINNNNIARLLPVPPAVLLSDGFDEEMLITLPDREATFMVRVAGRELAVNGGVVMALHGVRFKCNQQKTYSVLFYNLLEQLQTLKNVPRAGSFLVGVVAG